MTFPYSLVKICHFLQPVPCSPILVEWHHHLAALEGKLPSANVKNIGMASMLNYLSNSPSHKCHGKKGDQIFERLFFPLMFQAFTFKK